MSTTASDFDLPSVPFFAIAAFIICNNSEIIEFIQWAECTCPQIGSHSLADNFTVHASALYEVSVLSHLLQLCYIAKC